MQKMEKIDLWVQYKSIFSPSGKSPELVKVPPLAYLAVDGKGDPNTSPAFRDAIGALYQVAYTAKFQLRDKGKDFRVMPLSGRFHAEDPSRFLTMSKKQWRWTIGIPIPSLVSAAAVKKACEAASARKNASPSIPLVRREILKEGLCAQILHRGPYADEAPTIRALHAFLKEKGYTFAGSHHEIYISDPNRTAPSRMKTIVRQPVKKA